MHATVYAFRPPLRLSFISNVYTLLHTITRCVDLGTLLFRTNVIAAAIPVARDAAQES
jgi:hypothetical protein